MIYTKKNRKERDYIYAKISGKTVVTVLMLREDHVKKIWTLSLTKVYFNTSIIADEAKELQRDHSF